MAYREGTETWEDTLINKIIKISNTKSLYLVREETYKINVLLIILMNVIYINTFYLFCRSKSFVFKPP